MARLRPAPLSSLPGPKSRPKPTGPGPAETPAAAVAPTTLPPVDAPSDLDSRIASDRAVLRELLSHPRENREDWLQDPRLREIAERLPQLQAEKEAARSEATP